MPMPIVRVPNGYYLNVKFWDVRIFKVKRELLTAGFFSKYFILIQAFQSGQRLSVVLAAMSSLIGVFYYLKVISHLYMKSAGTAEASVPRAPKAAFLGILLCGLAMIYFAFVPVFF
jgi:NADH-quinone oxidoreductase subunit N